MRVHSHSITTLLLLSTLVIFIATYLSIRKLGVDALLSIWLVCLSFWIAQVDWAYYDGWAFDWQLRARGIKSGFTIFRHGGLAADITVLPPTAWIILKYPLPYESARSYSIAISAIILAIIFVKFVYEPMALEKGEAHTHYGWTPLTGWIHAAFFAIGLWLVFLFVLCPLGIKLLPGHMFVAGILLSVWATFGVVKFGAGWHWDKGSISQAAGLVATIWIITACRLLLQGSVL